MARRSTRTSHIHISQLLNDGVYDAVQKAVQALQRDMQTAEDEWKCTGTHNTIQPRPPAVFTPEQSQPEWARRCIWDTQDAADCVPLRPFTEDDPAEQGAKPSFFIEWGDTMGWSDEDMLRQMTEWERLCESHNV